MKSLSRNYVRTASATGFCRTRKKSTEFPMGFKYFSGVPPDSGKAVPAEKPQDLYHDLFRGSKGIPASKRLARRETPALKTPCACFRARKRILNLSAPDSVRDYAGAALVLTAVRNFIV